MKATDQLIAEHEKILLLLDVLERMGDMALEGSAPLDRVSEALDLIRGYADELHHGKEENVLFPLLAERGMAADQGPIGCMLKEHDIGRMAVTKMEDALADLRAGEDAGAAFAGATGAYTHLLRDHIDKENMVLFPWAERIVDDVDRARLETSFARVETDDVGSARLEAMLATLKSLAAEFLVRPAP